MAEVYIDKEILEEGIQEFLKIHCDELSEFLIKFDREKRVPMGTVERILKGIEPEEEYKKEDKLKVGIKIPIRSNENEKRISTLLRKMGMRAHLNGYRYSIEAIMILQELQEDLNELRITKDVYPKVVKKFRTVPSSVERCIRTAIEDVWKCKNNKILEEIFITYPNGTRPTNSEFLATIADWCNLNV